MDYVISILPKRICWPWHGRTLNHYKNIKRRYDILEFGIKLNSMEHTVVETTSRRFTRSCSNTIVDKTLIYILLKLEENFLLLHKVAVVFPK